MVSKGYHGRELIDLRHNGTNAHISWLEMLVTKQKRVADAAFRDRNLAYRLREQQ